MPGRVSQAESVRLWSALGEPGLHPESREAAHFSRTLLPTLSFRAWAGGMEGVAMSQKTQHLSRLCLDGGGHQPPAVELAWLSLCPGILYCAAVGEGGPGLLSSFAGCEF